jgi:cytochrome c oxidase subunit 4
LTLTDWIVAWWIAFGPHGPRAEAPPGEWTRVFLYSGIGLAISAVVFLVIHSFARPPPRSMTKEWQEATNEYLKVRISLSFLELAGLDADTLYQQKEKSNPLHGLTSEGYTGKGHVQSKSAKAQGIKLEGDD